jgi:hypothetical protein
MNFLEAQDELAESIKTLASKVKTYFWRLSGNDANSLCRFLGMEEEKLMVVLRLCKVYIGEKDNFSKNNFESVMAKCGCDFTTFKYNGRQERYIKIGEHGETILPKDMYGPDGSLLHYPVEDEHVRNWRTKSQKGSLPMLVNIGTQQASQVDKEPLKKPAAKVKSTKQVLFGYVEELVMEAANSREDRMSQRSARKLHRLIAGAVDLAAKELLQSMLEKYASENMFMDDFDKQDTLLSPEKVASSTTTTTVTVTPMASQTHGLNDPETVEDGNSCEVIQDDDDLSVVSTTTTDEFLMELKDEVLLQSLLHKRIHEKKERVFHLEHRNGHKLLVVLPPNTQSVSSFLEEATRTNWVSVMLNTEEQEEGMMVYLAKNNPDKYVRIGQTRKLSMQTIALNTSQTIALARVGRLNDVRMKNVRSFLRHIGKVNLQLSLKEQDRIDIQVGLHRTKQATFGSHLHEWSLTKGKEKKPPEQVHYWNSDLEKEIEAEVDLYLRHLLVATEENNNNNAVIPCIDYKADGFDNAGITVLFGGDHGDKHCPISVKLNLSSPEERKHKDQLSYQCPVVQFASVQCTKDAYDLMNTTVMPTVKQQLLKLQESAIVTVYSVVDHRNVFRSFTVPSSIRPGSMAFQQQQPDPVTNNQQTSINMTFAYGIDAAALRFGTVCIDDPVFEGVPYYQLAAKVTVSSFNELFIGDLAFLAMLIGMNNSSGNHCLMCMLKGSEFNCEQGVRLDQHRTKESLVECLEEFMILTSHPTRKGPANYKGVNGTGLLDIDPQRIVIPILHCPMGLVDKVLESFKHWVNLEVEDFRDHEMEAIRSLYKLAKEQHEAAKEEHAQAKAFANANPQVLQARVLEKAADTARKDAKKEESKAKERYDDKVQQHNAKKSSLNQQFEDTFRKNGVKREHYHGGKFNGVNCIRIMNKAKELVIGTEESPTGFLQQCLLSKIAAATTEFVQSTCNNYSRLLGLLDAIWSSVRGIECGLLPTDAQKLSLQVSLEQAKSLWLAMDLSTLQPKWHLTFDGHLLHQFNKYGGLADKSDETIEKGHQTLKLLRDRFRGVNSYEMKEACIRRELRRSRSPEIQRHIDRYEARIKQVAGNKRAIDTADRQDNKKKAKQEKRAGYSAV